MTVDRAEDIPHIAVQAVEEMFQRVERDILLAHHTANDTNYGGFGTLNCLATSKNGISRSADRAVQAVWQGADFRNAGAPAGSHRR